MAPAKKIADTSRLLHCNGVTSKEIAFSYLPADRVGYGVRICGRPKGEKAIAGRFRSVNCSLLGHAAARCSIVDAVHGPFFATIVLALEWI